MDTILTGFPANFDDLPEADRKVYAEMVARVGVAVPTYAGAIERPCRECKVGVAIGPRQQEALAITPDAIVMCMICAVHEAHHKGGKTNMAHLGNPGAQPRPDQP